MATACKQQVSIEQLREGKVRASIGHCVRSPMPGISDGMEQLRGVDDSATARVTTSHQYGAVIQQDGAVAIPLSQHRRNWRYRAVGIENFRGLERIPIAIHATDDKDAAIGHQRGSSPGPRAGERSALLPRGAGSGRNACL